jgi:hypothetical protein
VFIDDPDAPAWRADFLGELPTAWCVPEPGDSADADAPGREPGRRVTVTILTGFRTGQLASTTIDGDGDGDGTAWLTGLEPFATGREPEPRAGARTRTGGPEVTR